MTTLQLDPPPVLAPRLHLPRPPQRSSTVTDLPLTLGMPSARRLFHVAFAPGGNLLAAGGDDGRTWLWELPTGQRTALLLAPAASVRAVGFALGGRLLASAGGNWLRRMGRLALCDPNTGAELAELWRHDRPITALAVSPDGRRLAAGSGDGQLRQWDLEGGSLLTAVEAHDDEILSLAYSDDGEVLASGGADRLVKLWDAGLKHRHTLWGHERVVRAVTFAPGARTFASADERQVITWDTEAAQALHRQEVLLGGLRGLALALHGRTLFTAANPAFGPAEVRRWRPGEAGSSVCQRQPAALTALSVSPDGTTLAAADVQGTVRLWPCGSPLEAKRDS